MKRIKSLLGLVLVLVVLICAAGIATNFTANTEDTTPTEEENAITIFTLSEDTVEAIAWKYSEDLAFSLTESGWEYTLDPVFPLDESYIDAALTAISSISSTRTIENVEDMDAYGLEVPICAITVTAEGAQYTLNIGEETGLGGQRYFTLGDGNVYLVDESILDSFSYDLYDLLSYESIPSMTTVTGISLSTTDQSYSISYTENSTSVYSDLYTWFMDGEVLDNELTEALIDTITSVSWEDCVEYNASDLSQYGLDVPAATVTVHYTETVTVTTNETDEDGNAITETQNRDATFTLHIGAEKDEDRYARLDGSNMIYLIDGDLCQTLLYTTYSELQPDEAILLDWDDVTALRITLDGETYTVTKTVQTITDEEGNETQETVYLLEELEVDVSDIWDALDGLETKGYATGIAPERSEEIRITFFREHDAYPEVELVFYQYDSTQCLTTLNGESTLLVSRADVVDLAEEITLLLLSET